MTKQNKGRKFFATTATAALVASAIVPVASAAEFQDAASISSWAKEAVQFLTDKGYIQGDEKGNFNPAGTLTRAEAAEILSKALDLKATGTEDFSDVSENDWFYNAVLATSPELFDGMGNGKFEPKAQLTREQAAKVIVQGYQLTGKADLSQFADASKASKWAVSYLETAVENGVINGKGSLLAPQDKISREEFATMVKRTIDAVQEVTPAVEAVKGLNAKELEVKFNTAVDAKDAAITTKYAVEGVAITNAVVSEDGMTVTLTTDKEVKLTNGKVTVKPIKTKADAKVLTEEFNKLITFADTTPVSVNSVEAKGTTAVITFDEPVQSEGTISLNGTELSKDRYTLSGKKLTITGLTAEQSYKVDIVGATDFANNIANPIAVNFTVLKADVDNSKPTVSTAVNGTEITFDFSEELMKQNLNADAETKEYAKVTVGSTVFYLTDADIKDTEDKTVFTIDAKSALGTATFINTNIKVEGQKDLAGNAGDAFEFNAILSKDLTPATLVSTATKMLVADDVNATTDVDALYLTFSEPVKVEGKLTVKTQNGIAYTTGKETAVKADAGFDVDGNGKIEGAEKNTVKVDIDLDSNSTYTFELSAKAVTDLAGNVTADTVTFNVTTGVFEATPETPTDSLVFGATPVVVIDNNVFTVEYAKDVTATATNAANYTLGGKELPAGTQLQFVDGTKKVRFTLPEGSITANGNYVLEASNVVDTKGNTLKGGKVTAQVALKENIVPVATKVTAVDSKTFTVDFSENIADQAAPTGVTVKIAGSTVELASITVAGGKLTATTKADYALTDSIVVEFKSTNLVDANNNKVKDGSIAK
ncbi:S-layer homology domain-containing protein [Lysinibacillus sp. OL1_EC]|uniref:S-layer homology domain-containing protein n=1 Tax=unclassified Lysinibacillus TaxID=2636778 RepID=UPI001038C62A|nr:MULTISPECIES: S-layer homology domain-containing protein [unclassified Lysinibacillus]MCM0623568.1 S-layer homology domain-containing protein [Lysinibacillus sp. OL1_EC]MCS5500344.1 S-layer homology domain-containing protein [Lysinibacillus sp. A4]TBV89524.1 S-layer homology domain-containing protein [Lysinibacillus sp. OL1]UKJ46654.1 S-layer homology domain-containing protein [Lysinibacillus sp. ACHW1.5]WGT38077.1 S-layer homology domain-containing protein [Lysinibacillus sp. 1 U-2021]